MYDAIVLGTGGVGSSALCHLAGCGLKVLGLDRFPPGHDRGSSHGQTRMIRMSYFEHPDYVPLLRSAYQLWDELEERRGEDLFHRTGLTYFGTADGVIIKGLQSSAREHGLTIETLDPVSAAQRFPAYVAPIGATILHEPDAGYLRVEDCVWAHLAEAKAAGADHRHDETILRWSATDTGVSVETDKGCYDAARLVITAGCWAGELLHDLRVPFRILRKHLHWFAAEPDHFREAGGCPCFFIEFEDGMFYGFPDIDGGGVKVAEHSGGFEIADPLADCREPDPVDIRRVESFMRACMPGVSSVEARQEVCFYTMTPDGNFIVDRHPEHAAVVFAAGLSGHGFKFASVLGKTLAELAMDGKSSVDIGFLGLNRPGLTRR
jgi:sarcosine oxidase